ncbi:Lysophospholipase D GDPD1 [Nymphon striatum]|nr:Lysophospholipase D GDPD1 [Nymphon striatum]
MIFAIGIGASLAGGYVLAACFFFKYPHCLHQRKNVKFKRQCLHISHRGVWWFCLKTQIMHDLNAIFQISNFLITFIIAGAGENLENTMEAFQNAVNQGTDMLEIDLHMTKDNHVVISHDNNLQRVTGQNVLISDLHYKDLPLLNSTLKLDFSFGQSCTNHKDRKIPLLEELFKRYPQMPINIDIKIDNDDLIKQVSDMIVKYNRESLTVWGNYRNKITYKCHKENPNVPTLFSVQRVIMLLVFTYTGLLPFIPLRESCLELFLPHIFYK